MAGRLPRFWRLTQAWVRLLGDGNMQCRKHRDMRIGKRQGFTLLEIAVVMVILGLLMGGGTFLFRPLIMRQKRSETRDFMAQAKETILAFTEAHGRLPLPDHAQDGNGLNGQEGSNCSPGGCTGALPYVTLNLMPNDAYKRQLKYEIDDALGDTTLTMAGTCSLLKVWDPTSSDSPRVVDMDDPSATQVHPAVVLVSGGPRDADGDSSPYDAITSGTYQGSNVSGNPRYIRHAPDEVIGFDDLVVYFGGMELYAKIDCASYDLCSQSGLTARNQSGGSRRYRLNGSGGCLNWASNADITVSQSDVLYLYGTTGCSSLAGTVSYEDFRIKDFDKDCKVGLGAGLQAEEDSGW